MALDHEAIYKAYPNACFISGEGALDANKNKINLVQSDIDAARTTLNNELAATKYKRDRATSYPSIQDQLDMQYWDQVNGTTKWKEAIAKDKADNPKP